MMKNKLISLSALLTALLICLSAVCLGTSAAEEARYTNPETGYRVVIIDELDLLTDQEEQLLVEEMQPVTAFGNAAFWTTDEQTYNEIDQARLKRRELFDLDSATLFAINMGVRKLTIQSYGTIYNSVNDSLARSITSNVSSHATSQDYYTCASEAFRQIYRVLEGDHIPEPMKVSSFVIISVMAGLVIAIMLALSSRHKNQKDQNVPTVMPMGVGSLTGRELTFQFVRTDTRVVEHSSSSSGGCSSCGGGGCGGGGCGGGGSSSF